MYFYNVECFFWLYILYIKAFEQNAPENKGEDIKETLLNWIVDPVPRQISQLVLVRAPKVFWNAVP